MKEYYTKSQSEVKGHYSAREMSLMQLNEDILISENGIDGWRLNSEYNFKQIVVDIEAKRVMATKTIKKWSWGAFALNWIWGLFNGIYWMVIILPIVFIPKVGLIIALIISLYAGLKGRDMSWKTGRWLHVENFKRVQRKWDIAGIIVFVVCAIVEIGITIYKGLNL